MRVTFTNIKTGSSRSFKVKILDEIPYVDLRIGNRAEYVLRPSVVPSHNISYLTELSDHEKYLSHRFSNSFVPSFRSFISPFVQERNMFKMVMLEMSMNAEYTAKIVNSCVFPNSYNDPENFLVKAILNELSALIIIDEIESRFVITIMLLEYIQQLSRITFNFSRVFDILSICRNYAEYTKWDELKKTHIYRLINGRKFERIQDEFDVLDFALDRDIADKIITDGFLPVDVNYVREHYKNIAQTKYAFVLKNQGTYNYHTKMVKLHRMDY